MVNGGHFKSVIWGHVPPFLTLVQLARMSLQLAALLNGAKRLLEAVQESDERHAIDDLIFPPETRQEELRLIVSMAERYVDILQTIDDRTAGEAQ